MFTTNNGNNFNNKETYVKPMSYSERRKIREQRRFDTPQHSSWLGEHLLLFESVVSVALLVFVVYAVSTGMFQH